MRLMTAVLACLLASTSFAQTPATGPAAAVTSLPAASAPAPDTVAVTVKGKEITEGDVEEQLKQMASRSGRPGATTNPGLMQTLRTTYHDRIVNMLVDDALVQEQVEKEKITLTDQEVDKRVDEMVGSALKMQNMSREELDKQMKARRGMGLDEAIAKTKSDPNQRKTFLKEKLVTKLTPEKLEVSEEEIKQFYEQGSRQFHREETVQASHILVDTRKATTDEEKAAARKKIEEVLAKAKQPGADFAALAKEYSDCPSKNSGGDLGSFPRQGAMVEPFAKAAFDLQPGQMSDIVETQFGYHIIKVTGRKPAEDISLEKAKPDIEYMVRQRKLGQAMEEYTAGLREKAKGEIVYPPGKEPASRPSAMRTPMTPPGAAAGATTRPVQMMSRDAIKVAPGATTQPK